MNVVEQEEDRIASFVGAEDTLLSDSATSIATSDDEAREKDARPAIQFSTEQQRAFDLYLAGANVFVTGPGGTGKSALIRAIYDDAVEYGRVIAVTSLTGRSAQILECPGATTIHSWSGVRNNIDDAFTLPFDQFLNTVRKGPGVGNRWRTTELLIIDEVSMLSDFFLEVLDRLAKYFRRSELPFGGMQLLCFGDFFQLPPVASNPDVPCNPCFTSRMWFRLFPLSQHVELVHNFRQGACDLQKILNNLRVGMLYTSNIKWLRQHCCDRTDYPSSADGSAVEPTKLLPRREEVDNINRQKLASLPSAVHRFELEQHIATATASTKVSREQLLQEADSLAKNLMCPIHLELKIGAQVSCTANFPAQGLSNGSQGIVVRFSPHTGYPVVKFHHQRGVREMRPRTWDSTKFRGVSVSQVPLVLCWAMTIHKAQGLTLDVAEVDVGAGIFEKGQTYVALSRVKTAEGLYIRSFDERRIHVDPAVARFYRRLQQYRDDVANGIPVEENPYRSPDDPEEQVVAARPTPTPTPRLTRTRTPPPSDPAVAAASAMKGMQQRSLLDMFGLKSGGGSSSSSGSESEHSTLPPKRAAVSTKVIKAATKPNKATSAVSSRKRPASTNETMNKNTKRIAIVPGQCMLPFQRGNNNNNNAFTATDAATDDPTVRHIVAHL